MKIICMIPVRLGSTRVKFKNIRFLGDKPLIEHIISTAKKVFPIEDIYINSSAKIFEVIAKRNNIEYHQRPEELSNNITTNDDFVYEFLKEHDCDWIIQAHSTSPFLTTHDIKKFLSFIEKHSKKYDCLFSVKKEYMEGICNDIPINWDDSKKMTPSQNLTPIVLFANGLMAFKKEAFIRNYEEKGFGLYAGRKAYIELKDFSTIDIDNEIDFKLAEGIHETKRNINPPEYFSENKGYEQDVPKIMKRDGVKEFDEELFSVVNINNTIKKMPIDKSWSKRIVNSKSNSITLIYQLPSEGNRNHYHKDWDEVWYIFSGEWTIEYSYDNKIDNLVKGDVIIIPRNTWHQIRITGNEPGLRFAISRDDILHIYNK